MFPKKVNSFFAEDKVIGSLTDSLAQTDVCVAKSLGEHSSTKTGDCDYVLVLPSQAGFLQALQSLLEAIEFIDSKQLKVNYLPTLELQLLGKAIGLHDGSDRMTVHLLAYADPWILERQECEALRKKICKGTRLELSGHIASPEVYKHFDLLQKATNLMVLLLNRGNPLEAVTQAYAGPMLNYISKWARITPPSGRHGRTRLKDLREWLKFQNHIAGDNL